MDHFVVSQRQSILGIESDEVVIGAGIRDGRFAGKYVETSFQPVPSPCRLSPVMVTLPGVLMVRPLPSNDVTEIEASTPVAVMITGCEMVAGP
jgi:hypothetical protein